jgi:hypothetical protein
MAGAHRSHGDDSIYFDAANSCWVEQWREFLDQFIRRIGQHGVDYKVLPQLVVAFEDWPEVPSERPPDARETGASVGTGHL